MKPNLFLIVQAARGFSYILREWLTPEEIVEANLRNKTYGEGVCASHDFCDANMAMHEAWTNLGIDPLETEKISEVESGMSEAMAIAWSKAWDIAKGCEFDDWEIGLWLARRKDSCIEAALNAACLSIQTFIGQDDGGVAGVFFTGANEHRFNELMLNYINYEQLSLEHRDA